MIITFNLSIKLIKSTFIASFPRQFSMSLYHLKCRRWVMRTQREICHTPVRASPLPSHTSVNRRGWNVCTLSSFTPVLKVLTPRQRDAAEWSCRRLVTLVTVAAQQERTSLTPEARLNSKTIRAPLSKPGLLSFLFFCPLCAPSAQKL